MFRTAPWCLSAALVQPDSGMVARSAWASIALRFAPPTYRSRPIGVSSAVVERHFGSPQARSRLPVGALVRFTAPREGVVVEVGAQVLEADETKLAWVGVPALNRHR